jgi:hypothetical protein
MEKGGPGCDFAATRSPTPPVKIHRCNVARHTRLRHTAGGRTPRPPLESNRTSSEERATADTMSTVGMRPRESSHAVALVAPSGREQHATLVVNARGIVLSTPGGPVSVQQQRRVGNVTYAA